MADRKQLARLLEGVSAWNAWRRSAGRDIQADLRGASLRGAGLTDADLFGANLTGANLTGANLGEADLRVANLTRAILLRADLTGANLTGANLTETDLTETDLRGADLTRAELTGANLARARVQGTVFADLDLRGVLGLDTVEHSGPSTIGIDTIYRSGGRIPEAFLRGAGVPEILITYLPSLVGLPFEYYTCFISHSGKDRRFCDRLHADLQAKGVRVWYFYEDARWGEPVWGEIDRSIRRYDKLVVVCSRDALGSGPVLRELERALQREDREGKNILFPIRIDDYLFDGWEHERKADVVAKVAGDFRGWRRSDPTYARAFDRFLKALQAGAAPGSA